MSLDEYADVLPRAFAERGSALRDCGDDRSVAARSRARSARSTRRKSAMSDAIGRMYAERYFPAEQKARVQAHRRQRHRRVRQAGRGGDVDVARDARRWRWPS